jgi:hypothetical protein
MAAKTRTFSVICNELHELYLSGYNRGFTQKEQITLGMLEFEVIEFFDTWGAPKGGPLNKKPKTLKEYVSNIQILESQIKYLQDNPFIVQEAFARIIASFEKRIKETNMIKIQDFNNCVLEEKHQTDHEQAKHDTLLVNLISNSMKDYVSSSDVIKYLTDLFPIEKNNILKTMELFEKKIVLNAKIAYLKQHGDYASRINVLNECIFKNVIKILDTDIKATQEELTALMK